MRTLRRDALEKLASLSVSSPSENPKYNDIERICRRCPGTRVRTDVPSLGAVPKHSLASRMPMGLAEIEALLALCKAAPAVTDINIAAQLLPQLTSYLPEAHVQNIAVPLSTPGLDPAPWEILTYHLTDAILALGKCGTSFRHHTISNINKYVSTWEQAANYLTNMSLEEDEESHEAAGGLVSRVVVLAISMLGFLQAATKQAQFWSAGERMVIIQTLRQILSDRFMITLETSLSMMRNARRGHSQWKTWKHYLKRYAAAGRPLGATLLQLAFIQFTVACASLQVMPAEALGKQDILELLFKSKQLPPLHDEALDVPIDVLIDIAADDIRLLDEGSDYLQMGSAWQQRLAFAVKANALKCFLCCSIIDEDLADSDALITWLEGTLADQVQIADEYLANVVFKSMAILAKSSSAVASSMSRTLPRLIVQGGLSPRTASIAAEALASILQNLPQDAAITTLYSLGNVLSAPGAVAGAIDRNLTSSPYLDPQQPRTNGNGTIYADNRPGGSVISLAPTEDEPSTVYLSIIEAIVGIANRSKDDKIAALAISMLVQKFNKLPIEVDAKIIIESATLSMRSAPTEFRGVLKFYGKICHDNLISGNTLILDAVMEARLRLSNGLKHESELFEIYLVHLLDAIVSKGDAHERDNQRDQDVELAAREIGQLLRPLATLIQINASPELERDLKIEGFANLQRDAWFNAVVHGFTLNSPIGRQYLNEMRILALYSQPLVPDDRLDQLEGDIELNTTLRRGKNQEHLKTQQRHLIGVLPKCEDAIRSLNYSETVFLTAAYLVENLRASAGECTRILTYFLDERLYKSGSPMGTCMTAIAGTAVSTYLSKTITGKAHSFSSPFVAQQLVLFFAGACHRIKEVRLVARRMADFIIQEVPSSLCQKSSLFALFELLSIMWNACLDEQIEEYEWKSTWKSVRGNVEVHLSDSYKSRQATLVELHQWAKVKMLTIVEIAPLDIKGLIQTYLSEFEDDGRFGHISLGRSFALEIGAVIPKTDQRLNAISPMEGLSIGSINTASDFIAQYTTRQEYRFVGGIRDDDQEWVRSESNADPLGRTKSRLDKSLDDANALLVDMESRTLSHKHVSIGEIRDVLRRAGALLCSSDKDQTAIVHHLVGIPFAVFTKQSIKLGISLWMGVIKENPRMESRIFVEIAENFENTVRKRRGLFDKRLRNNDPFFTKMEFAPSDHDLIVQRQAQALDLIAPHLRLVQFLSSHYNATRLGSPYVQRIYHRLMTTMLTTLAGIHSHPLAREAHFHIILLGFKILQYSTELDMELKWRMKDRLLSAALGWFASDPKWTFGSNRVQATAEVQIMEDVKIAMERVKQIGAAPTASRKSLHPKQDLLALLLSSEQSRLLVWLHPLQIQKRHHHILHHHDTLIDSTILTGLKTAWTENPAMAVQMVKRYPMPLLKRELRWLVINFPEKVLDEHDALEVMLGQNLPGDVTHQLKYLLYWAPCDPMTAVTYFLPAYRNHPFIVQYAMRALESHSVDVTFFYVPQIVQTLRYDQLGYVERYIIETAKFSQLFAHQIIWNMKANAYKDEESTIPDDVKPTLDHVTESLIASFSTEDKAFYHREFAFFDEVTDISGKLKPYIKRPKPEKKQKIEEELRKINVEVGVYLPSNPDGVVIGIDRKSGKPLQSHAKAPYMATFRIRKELASAKDENEEELIKANGQTAPEKTTYEVWQSAIFKVGDDCRQDVLALQLISAFRGIFHSVGLDVYVFPYRVTATAPGCGVIDVLPNSISRDMLGREAVNGLEDYFISKYGGKDSIRYQEARLNFVKSMAAYSVISFLLQFKDRHNGNIMIDDAGHILHIDFGFCFDIVPGGVKFERAPFKLTAEMIAVMGGPEEQAYRWFEELCVKSFLAARQHCEHLSHIVTVMLDSGLPCFKPETIQHFRERFVLEKSEREAAEFCKMLIRKSYMSYATRGYDHFQLLTNGIPY